MVEKDSGYLPQNGNVFRNIRHFIINLCANRSLIKNSIETSKKKTK